MAVAADKDHRHDLLVVGGGIAGLSAAYRVCSRDILVLESADRPGGRILSTSDKHGIRNFGAHMFGGPGTAVGDLCCELGLSLRPIDAGLMGFSIGSKLFFNNKPALLPFQLPLPGPARLSLLNAGVRLRAGSALASVKMAQTEQYEWDTMTAARIAFMGQRTLAQFLSVRHPRTALIMQAITERCGGDPAEISAGHGLRSFANVWSSSSPGFNLLGGSSGLPNSIGKVLGDKLRLGYRVDRVRRQSGSVLVVGEKRNGEPFQFRGKAVILATPAPVTRRIAEDIPERSKSALDQIRYGPFLSVALNLREDVPGPLEKTYAVSAPDAAFSVLFNQATNRFTAGGHECGGSLMMFAGAQRASRLIQLSDEMIIERFVEDLRDLMPDFLTVLSPTVQRWKLGAPYSFPGRDRLQADLTQSMERIALAGDYLDFPNMDAAIRSASEAVSRIRNWL